MKKLEIKCGTCDATGLSEDMLLGYDAVEINCGTLFATPEAQRIMMNRGVEQNAGIVLTVQGGAELVTRTGAFTLTPEDVQRAPAVLVVTGTLKIEPGAGAAADSFLSVHVIGSLICARSDRSSKISVVGSETVYPDGYEYVSGGIVLDRAFRLSCAGRRLYTRGTVTVGDIDELGKIAEAGTRVLCGRLAAPESAVEAALAVARTERPGAVTVMPDGYVYLPGRTVLTKRTARRHRRLWIDGTAILERGEEEALSMLEGLHVSTRAVVPEELADSFDELDPDCPEVLAYRGTLVRDRETVKLSGAMLEREGFVTCFGCDLVALDPDIPPELIERRLAVLFCDTVTCTPEQEDAVRSVCRDVDCVAARGGEAEEAKNAEKDGVDADVTEVDCGTYKF